jgi:hypothetical protein
MSRVLAYTSPARGHLFPLTPILDELRSRGHDVAVRTLASQVELMRTRGFAAGPSSRSSTMTGASAGRRRRCAVLFTPSARVPSTTRPTCAEPSTRSAPTPASSTSRAGVRSRLPRHGAGRKRRSVPTRCRCPRGTCRRSAPGWRPRVARSAGCVTAPCGRSCSGRSSGSSSPSSTTCVPASA